MSDWEKRFGDEKEFVGFLETLVKASKQQKDRIGIESQMQDIENAMKSRWESVSVSVPSYMNFSGSASSAISRQTKAYTNILRRPISAFISEWASHPPMWSARPPAGDWVKLHLCEITKKILEDNWHEQGMDRKQVLVGDMLAKAGMAICHYYWDDFGGRERIIPVTDPSTGMPVMQQVQTEDGSVMEQPAIEVVREGSVKMEIIHPKNFFCDPLATPERPMEWAMIVRHMPKHWLEGRFPQEIIEQVDSYYNTDYMVDAEQDLYKNIDDRFLLIEYFEAPTPSNPNGRYVQVANFTIILNDDQKGLRGIYNPDVFGRLPFVIYYDMLPGDADGIWGQSRFLDLVDNGVLDIYLKTAMIAHTADRAFAAMFPPKGAGVDWSNIKNQPGAIVPVDYSKPGIPSPSQWAVNIPDMSTGLQYLFQANRNEVEDKSMIMPVDMGGAPGSMRANNALVTLQTAAQQYRSWVARYNEDVAREATYCILTLVRDNYTDGRLMELLGSRKDIIMRNFADPADPTAQPIAKVSWREAITDPKNVIIERGAMDDRNQRQQQAMMVIQQIGQNLPPDKIRYILEDIVGIPMGDEPLVDVDLEKDMIIREILQLLFGTNIQGLDASPEDDHGMHMWLMQLARLTYADDPSIPKENWDRFRMHFEHHKAQVFAQTQAAKDEQLRMMALQKAKFDGGILKVTDDGRITISPPPPEPKEPKKE